MTSLCSPRVTIRDVAEAAGVGIKTVSRVVNNERNVAPATAARVRAAIDQLGWHPDTHAANLRRAVTRTRTVGLLLGNVANPFSAAIHRAIEDAAAALDIAVFASSLDEDPEREIAAVAAFLRRKVDGLVLTCVAPSQGYLSTIKPDGVPVVFIDRPARDFLASSVYSDNHGGAFTATSHLLGFGHRRVALLADRQDIWTAQARREGFLDALRDHGIDPERCPIVSDLETPDAAEDATLRLLSAPHPPTAFFSAQNLITIGVVRALRRLGRQHEIAVMGFDDIELGDLIDPGISVVAQDPTEMGRRAAALVFAGPRIGEDHEQVVLPTRLRPRGSGEIRPPAHGAR